MYVCVCVCVSQSDIGWLGFAAVMAGCLAAVVFGRLMALFHSC